MGWPGLAREVQDICRQTGLPDATNINLSLDKVTVKEAIKVHHLQFLKDSMTGQKLESMKRTDMRERRHYTKLRVDECRMAFRLEVFQFECRANMPTRYKRDLRCRACGPGAGQQDKEQDETEEQQQQQDEEWHIEDQDHLEICPGYSELWAGLGPLTEQSRIKYFMRVKLKRLKQQQQQQKNRQQQQHDD